MRLLRTLFLVTCLAGNACSRGPSYELRGQVVAVDPARQELTITHGDIKGFMPGMTMAFKVREKGVMAGKAVGDLVRATLVVEDSVGYLTAVDVTGHAPLREPPPTRPAIDMLAPGDAAPDVALIDQDGTARRLSDWRGQVVAITFVYTRCPLPDFCPLMDRQFAAVQREASDDPQLRDRLHLVSVSVDPTFDRPPVLLEHAQRVGAQPARWSFVTGDPSELERFGSRFGVSVLRDDPAEPGVVHNLRTAVLDPQGRLTMVLSGNEWSAADLLKELRRAATSR